MRCCCKVGFGRSMRSERVCGVFWRLVWVVCRRIMSSWWSSVFGSCVSGFGGRSCRVGGLRRLLSVKSGSIRYIWRC